MGRKAIEAAIVEKPVIDHEVVIADLDGARSLALAATQQDAQVRAVAARIGYQLPAECTDPDLIQRDIAANMRRSVEACLEVGRGLAVLKEACAHGNFMARLEVLGIEPSVAQRFMQAAVKFSNAATSQLLKAAGNQSKLFELLVLDDEQVEELELTGQTGELTLDDVATMGVRELRAALRKVKEDVRAKDEVAKRKDERINALEEENARLTGRQKTAALEEEDKLRFLTDHAMMLVREVEGGMRSHIAGLEKLFEDRPVPNHVRLAQQQALSQVIQAARVLAGDFGIVLKVEDMAPQENLWLTQAESLFGDGEAIACGAMDGLADDLDADPAGGAEAGEDHVR